MWLSAVALHAYPPQIIIFPNRDKYDTLTNVSLLSANCAGNKIQQISTSCVQQCTPCIMLYNARNQLYLTWATWHYLNSVTASPNSTSRSSINNNDTDVKSNVTYKQNCPTIGRCNNVDTLSNNREMQQCWHIIQSDDHLTNREVETVGFAVSPFHKSWNKTFISGLISNISLWQGVEGSQTYLTYLYVRQL